VLDFWGTECVMWVNAKKHVYCYVDNDAHGFIVKYALTIEQKVLNRLERSGNSGVPKSHRGF
jgi:hypothetical protein